MTYPELPLHYTETDMFVSDFVDNETDTNTNRVPLPANSLVLPPEVDTHVQLKPGTSRAQKINDFTNELHAVATSYYGHERNLNIQYDESNWRKGALCAALLGGEYQDLFINAEKTPSGMKNLDLMLARIVCSKCVVLTFCTADTLQNPQPAFFQAGMTPHEQYKLKHRNKSV